MLSQTVTQNLSRALREAVRQATEDNLSNPSVTPADVIAALRQLCNETLSERLRSSSLRRPELPIEIWGYIWESLDLVDRVAISHVSRAWRAAALRNPRLWSEINISSSRHYDECQCVACVRFESPDDKVVDLKPALARLAVLLERSANARASVTIRISLSGHTALDDPYAQHWYTIAEMLRHRAANIGALIVTGRDEPWLCSFMARLPHCSELRHMSLSVGHFVPDYASLAAITPSPLLRLQSLSAGPGYVWDLTEPYLPALTQLHITFSGIDQVLDVFRLCPKLTHLRACLDFTVPGSDDVYADIRRRSGGLKRVALFQIPSSWNDRHIRAFVPSEASMVSLDYNVRGPSRFDLLAQLHAGRLVTEGFMFGQLCGPIRVVVLQSYTGMCSMEMSDGTRSRKTSWTASSETSTAMFRVFRVLLTEVNISMIVELRLSWELRGPVLGASDSFPSVEHLIIAPPNGTDYPGFIRRSHSSTPAPLAPVDIRATLPALSRVTICPGAEVRYTISAFAHLLEKFIRSILPEGKLRLLTLRNVSLVGDRRVLDALASEIVFLTVEREPRTPIQPSIHTFLEQ